jgi:hypothetical protein
MWKKIKERQDQVEIEVGALRSEVQGLREATTTKNEKMEQDLKSLRDCNTSLQAQFDTIRQEILILTTQQKETEDTIETMIEAKMIKSADQAEAKHLEDKIETIIEAKMIKSADQAEAKHLDEIKKMRAVINESDKQLDCVIDVKIAETMEKEKDRTYRKNNVIVYGIQESEEID